MSKLLEKHFTAIEDATLGMFDTDVDVDAVRWDAAKSCNTITIEFAKGFAKWVDDNGYTQNADGGWEGISSGLIHTTTEELLTTYIDSIK